MSFTNRFLIIITAALFCAAVSAQAQTSIKAARTYHQDGISIVSPNQPGWIKLKTNKSETAFEKRTETDILAARIKTIQTRTFETDEERLPSWEALKNEEFSKFKQDHLDFTYMKFKGVMCLHYDAFFPLEKTSSNKFAYYIVTGFLYPVSNSNNSAFQIEFSGYSNNRGFTKDQRALAEEFLEKLTFNKKQ
jgi:hypothetical protein